MPVTISQTIYAEVAHSMPGHPVAENKRLHGHSLKITVTSEAVGERRNAIMDFGCYGEQVKAIVGLIDHRHLNDIEGLGEPTLENVAEWLGVRFAVTGPLRTVSVKVEREHLGQAATWTP